MKKIKRNFWANTLNRFLLKKWVYVINDGEITIFLSLRSDQLSEPTPARFLTFDVKISWPDCWPPYFEVNNLASDVNNLAREVNNLAREINNLAREVNNLASDVNNVAREVKNLARKVNNLDSLLIIGTQEYRCLYDQTFSQGKKWPKDLRTDENKTLKIKLKWLVHGDICT